MLRCRNRQEIMVAYPHPLCRLFVAVLGLGVNGFFAVFAGGWYGRALRNCVECRDRARPLPADGPAAMVSPRSAKDSAPAILRTRGCPDSRGLGARRLRGF